MIKQIRQLFEFNTITTLKVKYLSGKLCEKLFNNSAEKGQMFNNLREVDLAHSQINDEQLHAFISNLGDVKLMVLSLAYCNNITPKGLEILTGKQAESDIFSDLRQIYLNGLLNSHYDDSGIIAR